MDKSGKLAIAFIILAVIVAVALFVGGQATGRAITSTQCSDRLDNDGDGRCDYGASGYKCRDGSKRGDTGCSSSSDNTETNCVPGSITCGVGACQRSSTCVNDQVSCTPGIPSTETCNNLDDDCDSSIDESLTQQCGISNVGQCSFGTQTCSNGQWGGCIGEIGPSPETCDGTIDNDCDGVTDEGCQCVNGQTSTCGTDVGACQSGTQTCSSGNWGSCVGEIGPTTEICGNSLDDDCDGLTNEGCAQPDSCSDTDGGNVTAILGTVSGYKNNVFYSKTDFCFTAVYVFEYYCSGVNAMNNSAYCGFNKTCSSGRCI